MNEPRSNEVAVPLRRRLRVLIVEDDQDDADLLLRELRRGDFDVIWERVQTADAMREALEKKTWDLVVSDYSMPEFDAPRALATLKASGLDLPFIVQSGTITEENAVEALRAGAHDFISKGKLARLLPAVERELREGQVRRARHEAELALRESERRYRRIIETTNEGVCLVDPGSCTTFVNTRMAALLGSQVDEVLGKSIFEFVRDDCRADAERALARREGTRAVNHAEICLRRPDGGDVWVLLDATPIFDPSDRYEGELVMVMDVTERKRLQDQLRQSQKLEAIGSLAGGVAHDFNNLLAVIASYAELLSQATTDEAMLEDLQEIQGATERAAGLTKQLLAFSRKQVMVPTVLDPNQLVKEMESMLGRVIGKGIQLSSRLGANIGRVKVDRGQVDQVILNLVVNARDAMPKGGKITIETFDVVSCEGDDVAAPPGKYVALRVTDTGTGMDAETQVHLFEPFFTTKEPGKGTGLGLATVHGIVQQSGGRIFVKSALGEGTSFTIWLPTFQDGASSMDASHEQVAMPADDSRSAFRRMNGAMRP